jgi:hypothetical protein
MIILVSPATRLFTSVGMAIFSFLNCKSISVGQAQKFSRHILSRTCGIRYSSFLLGHFALTSSLFFAYHKLKKLSAMTTSISVNSLIQFAGDKNVYEVYSIRPDGKFYFWNINDHEQQYTGYLDTTNFTVLF